MTTTNTTTLVAQKAEELSKLVHGPVFDMPLSVVMPSPENDTIYDPADPEDTGFHAMVQSVREFGIKEPLVLTLDNYILSGHRRYAAATAACCRTVPVRYDAIRRLMDDGSLHPHFIKLLRLYNHQRVKNIAEQLREQVIDADPDESYRALLDHREQRARHSVETLHLEQGKPRCRISSAKEPMLAAIAKVLRDMRCFWPLSVRAIHYQLLNNPPLIHASKPDSTYQNNKESYKALVNLATRARLVYRLPFEAITDETRPVSIWDVHDAPATFFRQELGGFLKGYRRNLQQSQPNHIEIVGEKNTVQGILSPVAGRYGIPLTIGRGFSSIGPRYEMAQRFRKSGKQKLILLVLSDFDPSGEEICSSFAKSIRDDFNVWQIEAVKVALTAPQAQSYNLPPDMEAKLTDSRAYKFIEKYGPNVFELESLSPEVLQQELRDAIDAVMDTVAFNQEIDAEKEDAAYLATIRKRAHTAIGESA